MAEKLTAEQKRWRAESDAECMARYEEIMKNQQRRTAAVNFAKQRAAELTKSANTMTRVANGGTRVAKPTAKKK